MILASLRCAGSVLVVVSLFAFGCGTHTAPSIQPDDVAVISEYLNSRIQSDWVEQDAILQLLPTTTTFARRQLLDVRHRTSLMDHFPELDPSTLDDFLTRNTTTVTLPPQMVLPRNVSWFQHEEIDRLFSKGLGKQAWTLYSAEYPTSLGRFQLSRVGFSHDRDQALLYVDEMRDREVYAGWFVLYDRVRGSWVCANACTLWYS